MLNKEKPVKVIIDKEKCTKCGYCLKTCENYLTKDEEGFPTAKLMEESMLGCIQCGRCMMKCPTEAIEIIGEDIDKNHLRKMPNFFPDYETLNNLLLKRRSIRQFKSEEVSKEDIDKILASAATSAVGIPPSEVKALVFNGRKKVQEFAQEICEKVEHSSKRLNPFVLNLMKIFAGENKYKIMKDFILPLCKSTLEERTKGTDIIFYNAPCVIVFYGTELSEVEDMIIAATTATIAAESLNLGTCFIGMIPYMLNNSKKLKEKYKISKDEKVGIAFILGHPDESHFRTFQRNFKEIKFVE